MLGFNRYPEQDEYTDSCEAFQFAVQVNTFRVYVFGWGKNRLWANHHALSCHIIVSGNYCLKKEGKAGDKTQRWEDKERNNQANSVGKKQTISSTFPVDSVIFESLSGYDSAYGILTWWRFPVMLSVQSALMDVRKCARCHLHIPCTLWIHKAGTCTH